tara:strand:+ start:66 stop:473 length:408 start_codon:yes stop_codon:yes gene_type:complete
MSHSIENRYLGKLRTESTHLKSSNVIITDAPVDNNGKGDAFSPTDLVASALCSCMTTVMGICAEKNNFELPSSVAQVTKIMESHPRRISKVIIEINFDKNTLTDQQTEKLVAVAKGCPVAQSLSTDLVQEVKFNF